MNRNFLTRLFYALTGLVVLWGVLALTRRVRQDKTVSLDIAAVDTAKVDTIAITRGLETSVIVRQTDGNWTVNGFRASEGAVRDLLSALADPAPVTELVAEQKASHARLAIGSDSGQRVRVAGGGKTLLDVTTGVQMGSYGGAVLIRKTDADEVFSLRGNLSTVHRGAADHWRDKRIATIEPDSIASIEVTRGARTYGLRRTGAKWQFVSGAAADSTAVANLVTNYREVLASGFAATQQPDSATFMRPRGRLRLGSKAGAPLASLVLDSTASGLWVRADSGGVVYRLESWTWNQIAPAESTLKAKKKG